MLSLSRLVADLYAKDGIRCNAVTPGPTGTDAWLGRGGLADQQGDRDEVLAKVGAGRPLGRLARAEVQRVAGRAPKATQDCAEFGLADFNEQLARLDYARRVKLCNWWISYCKEHSHD